MTWAVGTGDAEISCCFELADDLDGGVEYAWVELVDEARHNVEHLFIV